MKNKIIYTFIILIITAGTVFAQKNDYSREPGYVDFGDLSKYENGERVTEVMIESHLLKMVSKLAGKEDPDLKELLGGLKLIKVNAFEATDDNYEALKSLMEKTDKKLISENWDRIVKTRSEDENANVYIKTDKDEIINGLVVIAVERDGDAAFVNIVGKIDLDQIGRLSEKFDIPELDKIKGGKHEKE